VVVGVKAKGFEVQLGGSLYSDAMGENGTPEGTYIGMVNANVRKIVSGLSRK
jgi:manganese/zinc/iron transport system substrate-binding protein